MQKALFIGGTGTISMAITRAVAADPEWELYLVNRGNRSDEVPENVHIINADIDDEEKVDELIDGMRFDCVCDFIGFTPEQVERDHRLFRGRCAQFIYISSASAYNKPCRSHVITEGTALANPFWEYSRNKIYCESFLMDKYEKEGFPVTIVRPSHTYDERSIPLGVHGDKGSWQVIRRMLEGKPVIVHGDGTSLWTMTFNEDFAKGFVGLMGNPHAIGESFQITSDETLTWNQIYEAIADALDVDFIPYYVSSEFLASVSDYDYFGSLLGDKANSVVFDNSKIKRAVPGFTCTTRFDQGVRKVIDYCLSHPECQIPDPEFDEFCDRVIEELEEAKDRLR
ncbi:MAG: SDR family oxidoreductase [Lachnospiraceae bacterium]|nr:SDR family oxidoreductase [Lachnospiraceae bacterium]